MERRGGGRRERRADEAERHIADMERRLGKEIAASVAGIRTYDGIPRAQAASATGDEGAPEPVAAEPSEDVAQKPAGEAAPEPEPVAESTGDEAQELADGEDPELEEAPDPEPAPLSVSVVDEDSVAAILERGRGRAQFCDLAVLDFASFTSPGGGYERGAWAQEEALCSESFLYNALMTQKAWYGENRRRNINCNLYRNRGLVVPAVRFTRGKVHAYADVIVVAAPNARRAREEYKVKDSQLVNAMRERIRMVLGIADDLGHDKLILGAFGCGVFGWDAEQVAEMFRAELAGGAHVARQVVFAVPRSRFDENLAKFQHVLGSFPDAPSESFAEASSRKAAHDASRAADADDDDDDWRKYL